MTVTWARVPFEKLLPRHVQGPLVSNDYGGRRPSAGVSNLRYVPVGTLFWEGRAPTNPRFTSLRAVSSPDIDGRPHNSPDRGLRFDAFFAVRSVCQCYCPTTGVYILTPANWRANDRRLKQVLTDDPICIQISYAIYINCQFSDPSTYKPLSLRTSYVFLGCGSPSASHSGCRIARERRTVREPPHPGCSPTMGAGQPVPKGSLR